MLKHDKLFREALETIRKQEKFNQQLLNDAKKTNSRLIWLREKLEDSTYRVKTLFTENIIKDLPSMRKDFSIQVSKAYRTPPMTKKEAHHDPS